MRQWQAIAAAIPALDLDAPSRVRGWRNREVVAHLSVQPVLLRRFLKTSSTEEPTMSLADNLTGTHALAELIDASAREGADLGRLDLAKAIDDALPDLRAADLATTVVTVQGPILLFDYLVTRCVEAVVHGGDLVPQVPPDPTAEAITADALLAALAARAPGLVDEARDLPPPLWIDVATGRQSCAGPLATELPVMT